MARSTFIILCLLIGGYQLMVCYACDKNSSSNQKKDDMNAEQLSLPANSDAKSGAARVENSDELAQIYRLSPQAIYKSRMIRGLSIPSERDLGSFSVDGSMDYGSEERKRAARLNFGREDKDYSIMGGTPHAGSRVYGQTPLWRAFRLLALANEADRQNKDSNQQPLATEASQWQTGPVSQDLEGYRAKRRRCNMDQNLGVKNPSFCDTDAYFGAADYSMRDVWDSAGKRR